MRRSLILVPLVLSVALLSGCAPAPTLSSDSLQVAPDEAGIRDMSAPHDGTVSGSAESLAPVKDSAASTVVGPQIITTVDLTVTVKKPIDAADDAATLAGKLGGSVSYRTERAATDTSPGSAQLTLRIPSAKLSQALEELKQLGIARDTSINSVDVGAEVRDLDARITSLQTSVDRLLMLMSQATSTENLLAVESMLSQRQSELEGLTAQQRYLKDQVQLSTVNLYLVSEQDTPAPEPDTFWTGLVTGWNAFVGFWAGVLVALGVLVPWLIAAGLIALIVIVWVKRARRRKVEAKGSSAEAAPAAAATTSSNTKS